MKAFSKNYILLNLFLLLGITVQAQKIAVDSIVLKDSTVIEASIKIVTDVSIFYLKPNSALGTPIELSKSEIAKIIYANGEVELMAPDLSPLLKPNMALNNPERPWLHREFIDNLAYFDTNEVLGAKAYYQNRMKTFKNLAIITGTGGLALNLFGVGLIVQAQKSDVDIFQGIFYVIGGLSAFATGTALGVTGTIIGARKFHFNKKNAQTVEKELQRRGIVGSNFRFKPSINPISKSFQYGVIYEF